jgi:hypothetical protein
MGVTEGITWPGYGTVLCTCERCGHQRELAVERFEENINDMGGSRFDPAKLRKRLRCSQCGSRKTELRRGYHHGRPPDNVRPIKRAR